LAGALMGAFVAGLVWLPSMPAAFGLGVLLGLAGVYLFKARLWRNAALLAAAIAGGLALIEIGADFAVAGPVGAGVVEVHTPHDWMTYDSVLGFRLRPDTVVDAVATRRGETVFHRTYTIDGTGARATPGAAEAGDTYLFIGDSFVFGEGLADDETLPAQFARGIGSPDLGSHGIGSKGHVVNLAVPGYGLNQLVRALETGAYDSYVAGPIRAVVTWIIPAQLSRVTGDGSWLGSAPRYVLGAGGALSFTSSFDAHRLADPLAALGYLVRQNLKSVSVAMGAALDRERVALFVALMARLKALVQARYEAPLVVVYEWPDVLPASEDDTALVPALEAIERLGMRLVSADRIFGDGDRSAYLIPHDGHPSALLVRLVARALNSQLGF
jgi:hypothetical protein